MGQKNMKKTIFSLVIIGVVGAIVGGATWAYFTATARSEGNIFAAGYLTIALDGTNNEESPVGANKRFFKAENMFPGDSETAYIEIKNTSDRDIIFGFTAENVERSPAGFIDALIVQVTLRPTDYTNPQLSGTPYGSPNNVLIPFSAGYTIRDIRDGWLHNVSAAFEDDQKWPLKPGYVAVYKVEVKMPFEAGNEYQGAQLTADLEVKGVQYDGWENADHVCDELGWCI